MTLICASKIMKNSLKITHKLIQKQTNERFEEFIKSLKESFVLFVKSSISLKIDAGHEFPF